MNESRKPFWIGAFLLSGLVLLTSGILLLSRDSLWSKPVEYVVYFTGALDGLDVGADVTYRGVKVGNVRDIRLSYDRKINDVIMPVVIRINADNSDEPITGPQLDRSIALLAERGLRAQLQTPSLLTGKAIVALDFFPGQEGYMPDRDVTGLTAIPTVPSRIDQAADVLRDLADGLKEVPLRETLEAANHALVSLDKLLASSDLEGGLRGFNQLLDNLNGLTGEVSRYLPPVLANVDSSSAELNKTMAELHLVVEQARKALEHASGLMDQGQRALGPQSELQYELLETLQAVTKASKTMQRTAESIEQQPQSLIFGKKP